MYTSFIASSTDHIAEFYWFFHTDGESIWAFIARYLTKSQITNDVKNFITLLSPKPDANWTVIFQTSSAIVLLRSLEVKPRYSFILSVPFPERSAPVRWTKNKLFFFF